MVKIFISYRRADSQERAHRIHDWLVNQYGQEQVFIDIHDIDGGDDFAQVIEDNLKQTNIMLVIIGEQWADEFAKRIANDEDDYVRVEVAYGLKNIPHIRVIPVSTVHNLIPDASMLPDDIKPILNLNFTNARGGSDFETDMEKLKKRINKHTGSTSNILMIVFNALLLGILLFLLTLIALLMTGTDYGQTLIPAAFSILAFIGALLGQGLLDGFRKFLAKPSAVLGLLVTNVIVLAVIMLIYQPQPQPCDDEPSCITPIPSYTSTITATATITPTKTNTPELTITSEPLQPSPTASDVTITMYRDFNYIAFCPQQSVQFQSIEFSFNENFVVNHTDVELSNDCLCLRKQSESSIPTICSQTETIVVAVSDSAWRNSDIEVQVDDKNSLNCPAQSENLETYTCNLILPLGD